MVTELQTDYGVVHLFRPLEDSRWSCFVSRHPHASVFHTTGWLAALQHTYGYTPWAVTTTPPRQPLENAWVFCAVDSWLTGRRWVSLPFSDHCQPLCDAATYQAYMLPAITTILEGNRLRYLETRPRENRQETPDSPLCSLLRSSSTYCFHEVDLTPELNTLYSNFHKGSTQRKIQRAFRERLIYEEGTSTDFIDVFFDMQVLTRRRHGLPPQPKVWFRNIIDCLGDAARIRVARKDKEPAAAILTICNKDTIVYKYGCSDARYHNLGAIHLLFWKTIEEARHRQLKIFDLGRTDLPNAGLATFKDRWGARRSTLSYSRYTPAIAPKDVFGGPDNERSLLLLRRLVKHLPRQLIQTGGRFLYRHVG